MRGGGTRGEERQDGKVCVCGWRGEKEGESAREKEREQKKNDSCAF